MARWEIRRCDLCGDTSHLQGRTEDDLERAGWDKTPDGRDICPVCSWESPGLLTTKQDPFDEFKETA
jgi:hypothetical protein